MPAYCGSVTATDYPTVIIGTISLVVRAQSVGCRGYVQSLSMQCTYTVHEEFVV